ncbi:NUDIX hydrolase [Donghicola sp. C2-DW-16]|uniref:NUDIX hydrolase n=1 Tax=Donghicola mangrovi TaxID=2729614 RepID=A0A850PXD7_9RHOB|nr:NUDIX hydrolase [Donghicola mangrovi]NVO21867.1 NUDIX hydrolase [Donghicola mangrovi]NVO26544.1 NUDIX hydrolase [Donghicola mangrovi]
MNSYVRVGPVPEVIGWRAAVVAAFDLHGRVLMQLRDDLPHVAGAGMWSMFGGAVEEGEDLITAAIREFDEETGIQLSRAELEPLAVLPASRRADGALFIHRCTRFIAPSDIRLGEGAGFGFLTRAQVAQYPVLPQMQMMLAQLGV